MLLKDRIAKELEKIRAANGGLDNPEAVVEWARKHETSALHTQFTWDDSEAAHKWRIEQARRVLRLQLVVLEEDTQAIRATISLSTDRRVGGGYRRIQDVLASDELTRQMLADALADLNATRRKYTALKALAGVWAAIDAASAESVVQDESRPAA